MMKLTIFFLLIFNFSHAVEFIGDFKQGSFILGKTDPKSIVFIDNRKIMSEEARERALELFDIENWIKRHNEIFKLFLK